MTRPMTALNMRQLPRLAMTMNVPQPQRPAETSNMPQPLRPAMSQEIVLRQPRQPTPMGVLALVEPPKPQTAIIDIQSLKSLHDKKDAVGPAFGKRTVVFLSASGGVGLSVLCSLTALTLHDKGTSVALVDADFNAGGLDILLGLENDKGLRFGTLNAPLGRIDGEVLLRRLPQWEGVPVLAFDSWNSEIPEWWEVQAAMAALERSVDVLVVDGAHGRVLGMVPDLRQASVVVAVELSVLGLARAKALLSGLSGSDRCLDGQPIGGNSRDPNDFAMSSARPSLQSLSRPSPPSDDWDFVMDDDDGLEAGCEAPRLLAIVGIEPRGASHKRGVVSVHDAKEYLGRDVLGPLCPNNARTSDALEGLGLKAAKADRAVMDELAGVIGESIKGGDRP
ncbi:hypothetical protein OZX73_01970 [Bifidobacterium sp. ESL0775]|uniref:hypothetical protein n=1 Tax=Bifidobacterium sp. ESL0775 TaxID=2983230 RepID=UPI0023F9AF4D|nr:hypothetical protein [Bifidobacterium sp. ESL0775]WEV69675.1 hypothetical protein OZX73_01970 [Bifidobacterium sp. ESL0775]